MDIDSVVNMTDKTLREFEAGDSLYISKIENGYMMTYFCEFVKLDRGVVVAKTISKSPSYGEHRAGEEIRARASSCYLWGKGDVLDTNYCQWFRGLDSKAGV